MTFDPDSYLGGNGAQATFNPDSYLKGDGAQGAFDPDAYLGIPARPNRFIEYAKPQEQKDRESMAAINAGLAQEYPDAGIVPDTAPRQGDITTTGQALMKVGVQAAKDVSPLLARVGIPVAAAISAPVSVPLLTGAAFLGTAGLFGEELARTMEGSPGQTPVEGLQTFALNSTLSPLKVAPGFLRTTAGSALEGSAIATQGTGESPLSWSGAKGAAIDFGARQLENAFLRRAGIKQVAQTQKTYRAIGDQINANDMAAAGRNTNALSGINDVVSTAGITTPIDDAINSGIVSNAQRDVRARLAASEARLATRGPDAVELLAPKPMKSASDSADAILRGEAENVKRAQDFKVAITERNIDNALDAPLPQLSPQASRMMDEYGKANPAVVAALGRAGVGFVAGNLQGDTIEEKLGYGLTYALTGAALSPSLAKNVGTKLLTKTSLGRRLVPEVVLDPLMEAIRQRGRDHDALLVFPKAAKEKLTTALKAYADPVKRQEADKLVYEYLTGGRHITTLPADLAEAALDTRHAIDALSDELIVSGVATGKLHDSIVSNMGAYLRRSYKIFTDPKFKPDQAVFDQWVQTNVNEALTAQAAGKPGKYVAGNGTEQNSRAFYNLKERPLPGGGTENVWEAKTAAELRDTYTKQAHDLLDRNVAEQFVTGNRTAVDQSIFKRRQNIDALTRQLLGEIDDPLILLSDTAPRMARNAAVFTAQKKMADIGERLGFFTRNPPGEAGGWVKLAEDDAHYNGFAGLYTTPAMKEALDSISKQEASKLLQTFAAVSAAAKLGKTLGSVKAYSSNLWGGLTDVVAQGHALQFGNVDAWHVAVNSAAQTLGLSSLAGRLDRNATMALYRDMVREGLVNKAVSGNDFLRTLERGVGNKVTGIPGKVIDKASRIYMAPESASKIFNLAGEMKTLDAAMPGATREAKFKMAAAKVRATTADYDYLPQIVRKLSLYGVLNPFIAYQADRFRVVYNTYKIAREEINSGNAVLAARGRKRMAAMTLTLGAAAAIGVNNHLSPNQEEALRRRLPERDRNGFLRISEVKPDGSFTYTNLNYVLPQSIVIEAAVAATRGDDPKTASVNFLQSLSQQLFSSNLVYGPVTDVARNETETGKKVRSPNDSIPLQVADSAQYLTTQMFMPLVVNEVNKMLDIPKQTATESGVKYTYGDMAASNLAGIRLYRKDLDETFRGDASRLRGSLTDDTVTYTSAKRRALTEPDKMAAYATFEARRKAVHDQAVLMVNDARVLGGSEEKIVKTLREGGLPARVIAGAMDGIYVPTSPEDKKSPSDFIEEWVLGGVQNEEQMKGKIMAVAKEDPMLARRIMGEYRTQQRDAIMGRTGVDALIGSFDEQDGSRAQYLAKKYQKMAGDVGREAAVAYLKGLRSKRILTPLVEKQVFEIITQGR